MSTFCDVRLIIFISVHFDCFCIFVPKTCRLWLGNWMESWWKSKAEKHPLASCKCVPIDYPNNCGCISDHKISKREIAGNAATCGNTISELQHLRLSHHETPSTEKPTRTFCSFLPAIESHNTSPSEQSDNALANPTGHEIDHNRRAFSILISNSDFFLDGNNNCEAN